jgi:hypothetical protein
MLGKTIITLVLICVCGAVSAFENKDAQIDFILNQMQSASQDRKEQILERLQWSGLSDPRLYDVFEADLLAHYQEKYPNDEQASLMAYEVRALGYSGNLKYQTTISTLASEAKHSRLKRHANKAKRDLEVFNDMQRKLGQVALEKESSSFEVLTYMRMLKTNDGFTQRLAARAMYHEHQTDQALLSLAQEKLKAVYMDESLDKQDQDTAAWIIKVLKQHSGYQAFLKEVAENTPHKKLSRYAK